jgi:hypothetical protein
MTDNSTINHLQSDEFDSILSSFSTHSAFPLSFDFVHAERLGKSAIVIRDLLSQHECDEMVAFIDKYDRPPLHEGDVTMVAASSSPSHRNNQRVCISSETFSTTLLDRLRPVLTSIDQHRITCDAQNAHTFLNRGFGMDGEWLLHSLNSHFRLCKYHPGGHFGPHYDSDYVEDPIRKRSLKTFMVYLNDSYEGGETNFVDSHDLHFDKDKDIYCSPTERVFASLKAKRGDCLVFDHLLLHEGKQVMHGEKYIIRSDLMYEKEGGALEQDEAGQRREEALLLYLAGVQLEEGGEVDAAIQNYRRAFKMCPEIEDAYS